MQADSILDPRRCKTRAKVWYCPHQKRIGRRKRSKAKEIKRKGIIVNKNARKSRRNSMAPHQEERMGCLPVGWRDKKQREGKMVRGQESPPMRGSRSNR